MLACGLRGIPETQSYPGLLLHVYSYDRSREEQEAWSRGAVGGWGAGAPNMKMELMYQCPKVDYTVAALLTLLCLELTTTKRKRVSSSRV